VRGAGGREKEEEREKGEEEAEKGRRGGYES
jgi:hypothetical protein